MAKVNCWEVTGCGRQPGGAREADMGVCPASVERRADGMNGGRNGGRACWAVAGTLCRGEIQGTFATKLANCMQCAFYLQVAREEGPDLLTSRSILSTMAGL